MPDHVYPGTNILVNKFGIMDSVLLEKTERSVSAIRILELEYKGITGRFDADHLKDIHRYIFQDIYPWAGRFRDTYLAKGISEFEDSNRIEGRLAALHDRIIGADCLRGASREDVLECLTGTFADLNHIHPFREGNGRTQRVFLEQLALSGGYDLDFSGVSGNSMRNLSFRAGLGDFRLMRLTLSDCLKRIESDTGRSAGRLSVLAERPDRSMALGLEPD